MDELYTFVKERVLQGATLDLCDLNGIQIARLFQPHHGINGHFAEKVLVSRQDLGAQGRPRDVHQIFPEFLGVITVVTS